MDPALMAALLQFGITLAKDFADTVLLPTTQELFALLGRFLVAELHAPTLVEVGARMLRGIATRWGAEWSPEQVADEQSWAIRQLLTDMGGMPTAEDCETFRKLCVLKNLDPNATP